LKVWWQSLEKRGSGGGGRQTQKRKHRVFGAGKRCKAGLTNLKRVATRVRDQQRENGRRWVSYEEKGKTSLQKTERRKKTPHASGSEPAKRKEFGKGLKGPMKRKPWERKYCAVTPKGHFKSERIGQPIRR